MDIIEAKSAILTVAKCKPHYDLVEVATIVQLLNSKTSVEAVGPKLKVKCVRKVKKFKKGDVFIGCGINSKARPFVIAKIVKNGYYCIPLTTTEDEYALVQTNSRFFSGFLCNYTVFVKQTYIESNFQGVLEDTRSINKAIKVIANTIQTDFL